MDSGVGVLISVSVFTLLAYAIYWLGGRLGARGSPSESKHLPYTGGEAPEPYPSRPGYHMFFRLALLFSVLHIVALVVSTLPRGAGAHRRIALVYLAGAAVSAFVLTGRED
jgi:NADH:ubiquinone oxidoreductase subunit 3 (subunit A)